MSFKLQGIDMLGIKSVVDADHFNAIRGGLLNSIGINNFKATNQGTATPASQINMTCDRTRLWDPDGNTPALAKEVDTTVDFTICDGFTFDKCAGGVTISGGDNASYPASRVFDDSTSTDWVCSQTSPNVANNAYIGYDFGAGVTVNVSKLRYLGSGQGFGSNRQITNADVQYSDNGTAWTTAASISIDSDPTVWQQFAVPGSLGAHRYWRILATSEPRGGTGFTWTVCEIEMMEALGGAGAGGLDTGSPTADTWYYLWLIGKCAAGDGRATDIASLASLSASSPTMPSGYTHRRLVGVCRTDSSGNLIDFVQIGADWLYLERQQVVYRTTTIARTTQSLADLVPPDALVGLITFRSYSPYGTSEAGGYLYVTDAENEITWFDSDKIEESQTTLWMPVPGQQFDYAWNDTVGTNYLYVYCLGFRWPIDKEP